MSNLFYSRGYKWSLQRRLDIKGGLSWITEFMPQVIRGRRRFRMDTNRPRQAIEYRGEILEFTPEELDEMYY